MADISFKRRELSAQIIRSESIIRISLLIAIIYLSLGASLRIDNCISSWEQTIFYTATAVTILGTFSVALQRQSLMRQRKNIPKPSRFDLLNEAKDIGKSRLILTYLPRRGQKISSEETDLWHAIFKDFMTQGNTREAGKILKRGLIVDPFLLGECLEECLLKEIFFMIKILMKYEPAPRFKQDLTLINLPYADPREFHADDWFDIFKEAEASFPALRNVLTESRLIGYANYIKILHEKNKESSRKEFLKFLRMSFRIEASDADHLVTNSRFTTAASWALICNHAINAQNALALSIVKHGKIQDELEFRGVFTTAIRCQNLDIIEALLSADTSLDIKRNLYLPEHREIAISFDRQWQDILDLSMDRGYYRLARSIHVRHVPVGQQKVATRLASLEVYAQKAPLILHQLAAEDTVDDAYSDCVSRIFHSQKFNINQEDKEGNTALHIAARKGHWSLLAIFIGLDRKIDINKRNHAGMTAYQLVSQYIQENAGRSTPQSVPINVTVRAPGILTPKVFPLQKLLDQLKPES